MIDGMIGLHSYARRLEGILGIEVPEAPEAVL